MTSESIYPIDAMHQKINFIAFCKFWSVLIRLVCVLYYE